MQQDSTCLVPPAGKSVLYLPHSVTLGLTLLRLACTMAMELGRCR
jgi:hypothetical protein